ncbi:MAG: FHA domain-containing protein [Ruminococcus sp.]
MNSLIEKKNITEMMCGSNFSYVLNDNSIFLSTEYKVLQSQANNCFVKCMKMYFNGKIQLFYLTNTHVSMLSILPKLNPESFLSVVVNLFGSIIEAKNNGFLSCKNIDISFDHIFIDPSTLKVKLVYIPASNSLYDDISFFENEIRVNLIKIISEMSNISSPKTLRLSSDLQNGSVTVEDIFSKLNGKTVIETPIEETPISSGANSLKLVAMNVQPRVEVLVNKSEFIIGKKQSAVDGVVSFNKMISRVHCKVICKQNQYYIEDLMSANGTYVNNIRIQPNVVTIIKSGDIVRLANSDFQVVIS